MPSGVLFFVISGLLWLAAVLKVALDLVSRDGATDIMLLAFMAFLGTPIVFFGAVELWRTL